MSDQRHYGISAIHTELWTGLTGVHEGVAGHGVAGEGQLPAGPVREAAGEGVLTVTHSAGLELRHTHTHK